MANAVLRDRMRHLWIMTMMMGRMSHNQQNKNRNKNISKGDKVLRRKVSQILQKQREKTKGGERRKKKTLCMYVSRRMVLYKFLQIAIIFKWI